MNEVLHYSLFNTQFGFCLVASTNRGVCNVLFSNARAGAVKELESRWPDTEILHKTKPAHLMVEKRIKGTSASAIKLDLVGTDFQKRVWKALLSIPMGKTSTYGAIATKLGDRKLSRAVGTAVGANPVGYIIPCHRVLKSNGETGGYRWGTERKKKMLKHEARISFSS